MRILIVLTIILVGCIASGIPYVKKEYKIGRPDTVTVGEMMVGWEWGLKYGTRGFSGNEDLVPKNGTRCELVYTGVENNILYVSYREFGVGDYNIYYAKPAFTQEIRYDLTKSDSVAFRDMLIRIHGTTSMSIRFSILREPAVVSSQRSATYDYSKLPSPKNIEYRDSKGNVIRRDTIGNSVTYSTDSLKTP